LQTLRNQQQCRNLRENSLSCNGNIEPKRTYNPHGGEFQREQHRLTKTQDGYKEAEEKTKFFLIPQEEKQRPSSPLFKVFIFMRNKSGTTVLICTCSAILELISASHFHS
jgi:hypothetical protein